MTDSEKLEKLRQIFSVTINWYKESLEDHDADSSYIYDMTIETVADNLSRSDAEELIRMLT